MSRDVIMHAVHFGGQERTYLPDQRVTEKEGKGKGEIGIGSSDEIWTPKVYFVLPVDKSPKMNCMHVTRHCIGRGAKY